MMIMTAEITASEIMDTKPPASSETPPCPMPPREHFRSGSDEMFSKALER
jgi:hypothetical protein